jgi:ABC-type multidrug transport system ATPase subunit
MLVKWVEMKNVLSALCIRLVIRVLTIFAVAENLCDIIGIIDKGVLKIEGSPREIIKSVNVKNLEEAYIKIMGIDNTNKLLNWNKKLEF